MPTKRTQTTTINGKRVRLITSAAGIKIKAAPIEEWRLQAEAVRQLRALPEFVSDAADVRPGTFTLAGDFNSGRRGKNEIVKAKATGLTQGEHDLRLYMFGGRLGLIEMKGKETPVRAGQKSRHALLAALGFGWQAVIRATTESEAGEAAVRQVRAWLAVSNDNAPAAMVALPTFLSAKRGAD